MDRADEERAPVARGALAGAGASLALWGSRPAAPGLSFAGVADAEAQSAVVAAAPDAGRHRGAAARSCTPPRRALGALLAGAWARIDGLAGRPRRRPPPPRGSCPLHVLACSAMMARYPQVYADRWWLARAARGGAARRARTSSAPGRSTWRPLAALVLGPRRPAARRRRGPVRRPLRAAAAAAFPPPSASALARRGGRARRRAGRRACWCSWPTRCAGPLESATSCPTPRRGARGHALPQRVHAPRATFPSWVSLLTGGAAGTRHPHHVPVAGAELAAMGSTFIPPARPRLPHLRGLRLRGRHLPALRRRVRGGRRADAHGRRAGARDGARCARLHAAAPAPAPGPSAPAGVAQPGEPLGPRVADGRGLRRIARDGRGRTRVSSSTAPRTSRTSRPTPTTCAARTATAGRTSTTRLPVGAATPTPEDVRADPRPLRRRADRSRPRPLRRLYAEAGPDTIVVVMGDHGEELTSAPGIAGHGDTLAVEAQRVPILLVRARGHRRPRRGRAGAARSISARPCST